MQIVLIDNSLSKSEAKFLLRAFINEKLNFHKLRRLSITEGNNKADVSWDNERIAELEAYQRDLASDLEDLPDKFPVECIAYLNEPLDEDDLYEDSDWDDE